jgi:hypothetical protein
MDNIYHYEASCTSGVYTLGCDGRFIATLAVWLWPFVKAYKLENIGEPQRGSTHFTP